MNDALFDAAVKKAYQINEKNTIGILGEHTLHSCMKYYFEPDQAKHEQKIGRYYADILRDGRIFEIQTRCLYKLEKKITEFLKEYEVTVVLPICCSKYLSWVDEEKNTVSKPRKSPKAGGLLQALPELYGIRSFISCEGFSLMLVFFDGIEYRALNGWSRDRKKGSERLDVVPSGIVKELFFSCREDYISILSPELPDRFNAKRFSAISGMRGVNAWRALKFLQICGAVQECGKNVNEIIYERVIPE